MQTTIIIYRRWQPKVARSGIIPAWNNDALTPKQINEQHQNDGDNSVNYCERKKVLFLKNCVVKLFNSIFEPEINWLKRIKNER